MLAEDPTINHAIITMSPFVIYFIGMIISFITFTVLNLHFKWIDKDDLNFDDGLGILMFIAIVAWPLTILVLIVVGLLRLYKNFFIPD